MSKRGYKGHPTRILTFKKPRDDSDINNLANMSDSEPQMVDLGDYLFARFKQLGVDSVFGVPGDFNLTLLDHVYNVDMRWVGNTNELNAGYSADGYSRVKRLACLVTTFGVGELSAVAAVAGSYAEHVGVVHVVGVPSTSAENKHLLLHHTLGNGDFRVFAQMSKLISEYTHHIEDPSEAADVIDTAIRIAYTHQRPVYIAVPSNFSEVDIADQARLDTPLDLSLQPNDPESQFEVIEEICARIKAAKKPVILVDACASRYRCVDETKELAKITNFAYFVTPMGKGSVDEDTDRYGGTYVGSLTAPATAEVVETADLIISVGALLSDFNTGSFSYSYSTKNVVEMHSDHVRIKSATYNNVGMKLLFPPLLEAVKKLVAETPDFASKALAVPDTSPKIPEVPDDHITTQAWLWQRLSYFLRPSDIVVTETGTSSFGIIQTKFPNNVRGISQVLWGSIGYSVGAACGASIAAQELDPEQRVILFVGDGSLQLTVTEISCMIRNNVKPYIFVLNNDGYTIERLIHGENASYNDVHMWKYSKILDTFNAKDHESIVVNTKGEMDALFDNKEFAKPDKIRLIEVMCDKMDAPASLIKQAELSAKTND